MMISALMLAAAIAGGDPDEVVATAPGTSVDLTSAAAPVVPTAGGAARQAAEPHNLTTDQQIDRWLASRDPDADPYARERAERPVDDRKMHGEFTAGIGTNGYRDYGMAVTLPVGENGRVSLSYRQTENGFYGYGYPGYGYRDDAFRGPYDPFDGPEYMRRPGHRSEHAID